MVHRRLLAAQGDHSYNSETIIVKDPAENLFWSLKYFAKSLFIRRRGKKIYSVPEIRLPCPEHLSQGADSAVSGHQNLPLDLIQRHLLPITWKCLLPSTCGNLNLFSRIHAIPKKNSRVEFGSGNWGNWKWIVANYLCHF